MNLESKRRSARESMRRLRAAAPEHYKKAWNEWKTQRRKQGYCSSCSTHLARLGFKTCRRCSEKSSLESKIYRESRYKSHLKSNYGISWEDYQMVHKRQAGKCPVCKEPESGKMFMDHKHGTTKVRGILHQRCNLLVGFLETRPQDVQHALRYIHGS